MTVRGRAGRREGEMEGVIYRVGEGRLCQLRTLLWEFL